MCMAVHPTTTEKLNLKHCQEAPNRSFTAEPKTSED